MIQKLLTIRDTMTECYEINESVKDKSTLTKAERDALDDDQFAVPGRKFPVNDAPHVSSAKTYFKFVPEKDRKKAANKIFDQMVKLGMPLEDNNEDSLWVTYLSEDREEILNHKPPLKKEDIEFNGKKWIITKKEDDDK